MMQILGWAYVIVMVVLLFGAAIFLHEFGHFWMARRRGLKVEGFSIGFGPKIFGWQRDGIDYAWRWIPAGGYVKLPQMVTSETLEGKGDETEKLPPISPLSKILVAFAGPLMNVVFAFLLAGVVYLVGLPIPVNPSIIGYVEPRSAEAKLGIQEGDRIVSVNGKLVRSWQDVQLTAALARTNMIPVVIEHDGVQTTYTLKAQANELVGFKLLNLAPKEHPVIVQIAQGSAAEQAGLKPEDQVISFAGVPVVGQAQLVSLIKKRPGEASEIEIMRGQERLKFAVTPKFDPVRKVGLLGVVITPNTTTVYQVQKPGPTPWENISGVLDMMVNTFSALFHSKETGIGAKDLSGPIGILSNLAVQVRADYRLALNFMVLLNINLAILNLLPLPVLDGGHILMALYEAATRRRVSLKIQEYATTAFAVLLISFVLYVTFFDVKRIPIFKSMMQQGTQIEQGDPAAPAPAPGGAK